MPKVFLTSEERRRAETDKKNRRQDSGLIYELREAAKDKNYTYEELAKKAGVGKSTVQKAFNKPSEMRIDLLRKICFAAGIQLEIIGTIQH